MTFALFSPLVFPAAIATALRKVQLLWEIQYFLRAALLKISLYRQKPTAHAFHWNVPRQAIRTRVRSSSSRFLGT
jgi:hypothetical protein